MGAESGGVGCKGVKIDSLRSRSVMERRGRTDSLTVAAR